MARHEFKNTISKNLRDALRPREVGTAIAAEVESWRLPSLQAFVDHQPEQFILVRPTEGDSLWAFKRRSDTDPPCALPQDVLMALVGCLLMATASRFAFRCGNLAVRSAFNPRKNWSAAIIAQIALLVTEPAQQALVLPKPSTKTSHNASGEARRLAREPVAVAHDPRNVGDLARWRTDARPGSWTRWWGPRAGGPRRQVRIQ